MTTAVDYQALVTRELLEKTKTFLTPRRRSKGLGYNPQQGRVCLTRAMCMMAYPELGPKRAGLVRLRFPPELHGAYSPFTTIRRWQDFNDHHTHREVMAFLDAQIAKLP